MLSRALVKDSLREVRNNPARFISIVAIVVIGSALFVGIKGAAPDMKYTADQYYDRQNMMDVRVLSTLGLAEEDVTAIAGAEGVESVQPGYFVDVTTNVNSYEYVFRVHSLPVADGTDSAPLNQPKLVSGRMPTQLDECVIEASRNFPFPKTVGDTITVASGTASDISTVLGRSRYRIVGTVVSPFYLTFDHGSSEIGGGRIDLFMMVAAAEFKYPAYTEALVTVQGARELDSYSDGYQTQVNRTVGRLQNLGEERAPLRLAQIKADAQAELDAAKADLAAQRARYDKEIGAAEAKLADASDKLVAGRASLEAQRTAFDRQIATSATMITQFGAQITKSQALFDSSTSSYRKILAQADRIGTQVSQIRKQAQQTLDSADTTIADLEGLLQADNLTDDQRSVLRSAISRQQGIKQDAGTALASGDRVLASARSQVAKAKKQMNAAGSQLSSARGKLASAKRQLAAAKVEAKAKFAQAEAEIAAAQKQYDEGKAELAAKKAEGAQKLKDGEQKIAEAQDQIDRLSEPTWYVLDRTKLYSYADYAATADRMDAIAVLFPVFFFAVAALVCLTTMTRMVDEQRTAIGAYKALGYGEPAITFKYAAYAALASLIGGVVGVVVGINTFPRVIFDSWAMMYELPPMEQVPQYALLVGTVAVSVLLTTATAYLAVRNELTSVPAALMRPKAPKAGKIILLERVPALWSRLSFSQKVTMRNIFRYKKRFFMTVIGVAGCAALLVAGFGLSDSIGSIVPRQYGQILKPDLDVRFAPAATEADRAPVVSALAADAGVAGFLQVAELNATVKGPKDELAATLVVPLDLDRFPDFVSLRTRDGQVPLPLQQTGAVITEKLAGVLGVRIGDMIPIDRGTGVFKQVVVTGIAENYVFHYVYLSPDAFREVFGADAEPSAVFVKTAALDKDAETALGTRLMDLGHVASVTYYSDAVTKFAETIKSLDTIVWAMIISAALLAFVVLYNLTIINLSERVREIATIKVLGFFNREVATYVYRENILLTIIGALAGLVVGVGLHRAIMTSIEQDNVMFGSYISGWSYVIAFVLTVCFGVAVSVFTYRKLTVVAMVESLKSIE